MKAFIAYDKSGRVTAVGIPNPELGDDVGMESPDGDPIVAVDVSEVVKANGQLSFPTANEPGDRLLVVRTIVERYRVDPASGRLVSKDAGSRSG